MSFCFIGNIRCDGMSFILRPIAAVSLVNEFSSDIIPGIWDKLFALDLLIYEGPLLARQNHCLIGLV